METEETEPNRSQEETQGIEGEDVPPQGTRNKNWRNPPSNSDTAEERQATTRRTKKKKPSKNGFIQFARHIARTNRVSLESAIKMADELWPEMDTEQRKPYKEQAIQEYPAPEPCQRLDCVKKKEEAKRLQCKNDDLNIELLHLLQERNKELQKKLLALRRELDEQCVSPPPEYSP